MTTVAATAAEAATVATTVATATTEATTIATATGGPAATMIVTAAKTATAAAAVRTVLIGNTRSLNDLDDLVDQGIEILDIVFLHSGEERIALHQRGLGLGSLDALFGERCNHSAHVGLAFRLFACNKAQTLEQSEVLIDLMKPYAEQLGHFLLLHSGLECEKLQHADKHIVLLPVCFALLFHNLVTTTQEATSLAHAIAKIALDAKYAANTKGRFLLMTWDNGSLNMDDAALTAVFDATSASGA